LVIALREFLREARSDPIWQQHQAEFLQHMDGAFEFLAGIGHLIWRQRRPADTTMIVLTNPSTVQLWLPESQLARTMG
jgi:hypothetical protein